jgi:PAS domain S-box-containing protein
VIAATSRPANYDQSILSWWQAAFHKGQGAIYISQPIRDPETESSYLIIVMPVRGRDLHSELNGFLVATYGLRDLTEMLAFEDNHPGKNSLLLPSGQILTDTGEAVFPDQDLLEQLRSTVSADFTQVQLAGELQLISQALVTVPASDPEEAIAFDRLNWSLIIHEDPDEAFAPLNEAGRTTLLSILLLLTLAGGLAVILSRMLVAPIKRLTVAAGQIAGGHLSMKAEVESQDEIGTLASTFNAMVDALSRAQQELQESEALYRNLVDCSPDLIALSGQGVCLFINPSGATLLGAANVDELIGQPIFNVLSPDDQELAREEIEHINATREPTALLHRKIQRVDGSSFEAELRAIPISHESKPAIQFVMRDITERKEAQEKIHQLLAEVARQRDDLELRVAQRTEELNKINQRLQYELTERQRLVQSLRHQERQLAQAVTLAKLAHWELNLRTAEFTFNDQFYSLLVTTAQKAGGYFLPVERYVQQFVHPEDAWRVREFIHAAQTTTSSTGQLEYRCICGDGQVQNVLLEYRIAFDSEGQPAQLFGAHMDITERQWLAQSLQESEERFRLLFEASPDAIFLIDPHDPERLWSIVDCNQSACTMNGYTRTELVGQSIDLLNLHQGTREDFAVSLETLRREGVVHGIEVHHTHKDGRVFPIEYSTTLIKVGERELVLGIDRDVTERKHAEMALQQAKEAAEAASRSKSEFLSRMSHELRTPMNAILGFAQLLDMSRKDPLTSTQQERVKQIVKGGQHLLDLINEILDISRIEANRLQISPEPVSIRESIQEALDLTVPLSVKRQIQIVTKLTGMNADPFVMADRQRFKQVLLNLLGNAVKYNRHGGSVIVTCKQTPSNHWRISIADTGPGISQEDLGRLFQPFERLVAAQSNVEGTGLGLTLAKRLIELMHGQIGVESIVGKGSTFWMELPSAESLVDRLQREGKTTELTALSGAVRRILYVEDNVANFELIQHVLADYSQVELSWATEPEAAIESAQGSHPNLILLDLHLGKRDGAEVLGQLKQDKETAGIPVIVISADATSGQAERLISQGAHAYLTKPLDVKRFIRLIDELLAEKEF